MSSPESPPDVATRFPRLLRAQWNTFWAGRARLLAMVASILVTVALGLLVAGGVRSTCVTGKGEGPCPAPLQGPDGTAVNDRYFFVHQQLDGDGTITARLSGLTGQIRLPDAVPGVRNVTPGVVPWAKAGLIVRQSLKQGTPYAAVMITGGHGVRMQHNFTHDVPGSPAGSGGSGGSGGDPRWLRLSRSGDVISGYESRDGTTWTEIGTVTLTGLPGSVEIGLFAASPGAVQHLAARFSQATAVFDHITLHGADGPWRHDDVGVAMEADGTTPHHPGAATESTGKITVTGSGDIGPATMEGGIRADFTLLAGTAGLSLIIVAAATFASTARRQSQLPAATTGRRQSQRPGDTTGNGEGFTVSTRIGARRLLAAQAAAAGAAAFTAGLVTSAIAVPAGLALLRANDNRLQPLTAATELRMIAGYAALAAAAAVLTVGIAALVRPRILAAGLALVLLVVPDLLAAAGLTSWLPPFTPSAGFAIVQSVPTYAHVDVEQSILGLYHPLPPWAGLAVTCGYAALTLAVAMRRRRNRR